jgi:hypothetical protein
MQQEQNLLDFIPVRIADWGKEKDGTIFLIRPKFQNIFFHRIITRMGIRSEYKIHLDSFGSYIWDQCDGHLCLHEIGQKLVAEFGESVEPVYSRLGAFAQILVYQKCIRYKTVSNC